MFTLITYGFGWGDLIGNEQITGNILKDVLRSITYYFTDVLIYWWAAILMGGAVFAGVTTIGYKTYNHLPKHEDGLAGHYLCVLSLFWLSDQM